MEVFFIYLFMGCLAAYALYLVFRGRNRGVADPALGFLNLGGEVFIPLITEDRRRLHCGPRLEQSPRTRYCCIEIIRSETSQFGLDTQSTRRCLSAILQGTVHSDERRQINAPCVGCDRSPIPKRSSSRSARNYLPDGSRPSPISLTNAVTLHEQHGSSV